MPTPAADNGSMGSGYLWVKAFHIVFVAAWFAALFYLPRLFVNLAMVAGDSHAERERLLLMARKLHRFGLALMLPALALGLVLWLGYGIGIGPGSGWMHAKLALVLVVIGYHLGCGRLLRRFERQAPGHGDRWFRVFNEAAVLLFAFLVWRVVGESDMVSMFVAGLVGRGSIVVRNTFYRIMGWQVPANMPEPDVIDVTPVSANESSSGLDEDMLREIGRYGLKNNDFRDALADGLGRRMNDWLTSQGRPPIEPDAINSGVKDIFESMANRG